MINLIFVKNRAISTVLTTIIIMVASLVLAGGVSLYGVSSFQQSSLTEAITVNSIKLWVHDSSPALTWGALSVRNTGDTTVSLDTINVRGSDIPYSNWYADTTVSENLIQQSLNHTGWSGNNGMILNYDPDGLCNLTLKIDLDGAGGEEPICSDAASSPISLQPTSSAIIYFKFVNGTISPLDAGTSTGTLISAGKATFITSITIETKS
jgi:hypothetical protein